jgi:putative transposase
VSNDNPYSEAQYRTLKYLPDFPDHFTSLRFIHGGSGN